MPYSLATTKPFLQPGERDLMISARKVISLITGVIRSPRMKLMTDLLITPPSLQVANADSTTLNAEQIMFVKRRTEPRAHAPSKIYYTAKVHPPSL